MNAPLTHGIHHLGFTVSDLPAARDFFTNALDFILLGENKSYPAVFLTDDVTVITLWAAEQDAAPFDRRRQIGLHHAAFLIDTLSELKDLYLKLKDWPDVEVECEISAPGEGSDARHFLIRMPGGPRLEFYINNFK